MNENCGCGACSFDGYDPQIDLCGITRDMNDGELEKLEKSIKYISFTICDKFKKKKRCPSLDKYKFKRAVYKQNYLLICKNCCEDIKNTFDLVECWYCPILSRKHTNTIIKKDNKDAYMCLSC